MSRSALPEAFTISLTSADDRRVFLVAEDDRFLSTPSERRATKFGTRSGAEDMIEAVKANCALAEDDLLTLCDQDGWPILDTIDIPILTVGSL